MFAHMHNGVDTCDLAQIRVEGNISVWRHQIGRVISLFRIDIVTARGLNTDKGFPSRINGNAKATSSSAK